MLQSVTSRATQDTITPSMAATLQDSIKESGNDAPGRHFTPGNKVLKNKAVFFCIFCFTLSQRLYRAEHFTLDHQNPARRSKP
jgi:hypothetical protein